MPSVQQHISKGLYHYSQLDSFISVKDYMFVRSDNRKCLLLRFSNDSDFTADSMEYTVVQLDSAGNVLGKTKIFREDIRFAPGSTYTADEGIVVQEYCNDFKILFTRVTSGCYQYTVKKGKVITHYVKKQEEIASKPARSKKIKQLTVKPMNFGRPGLAILLGVCALLLMILLNLYNMYEKYIEATQPETETDVVTTQEAADNCSPADQADNTLFYEL